MIRGQPHFTPWQEDPEPPEYWEEQDYEEMRARLRKHWGSMTEDADFDETLHPRDPEGKFAKTTQERVEAALEKAFKELHPNPLAEHQIGFGNKEGTGVVMMELENYTESLYVKWLMAYPHKAGMGAAGIKYLKELATEYQVPLTLTPWKHGELGEKKLTGIFKKWGFVLGRQGLMWWRPPVHDGMQDAFGRWEEQKHPRGQPENKGQFGPGGGGQGAAGKGGKQEMGPPRPSAVKVLAQAKGRAEGTRGEKSGAEATHPGRGYSKHAKLIDGVIHTTDVADAQRALFTNKKVEFDQPKGVSILLERLGEITDKMIQKGEKAPTINLCNLTIKGTSLFCANSKGIPRIEMPQMTEEQTEDFKDYLVEKGYTVTAEEQYASHLHATQNELNGAKVAGIAKRLRSQEYETTLRTVVSDDDYILDGHHRWAAKIGNDSHDGNLTNDTKYPIARIGIDIITLLEEAHKFTGGKGRKGVGDSRSWFDEKPWDEQKHPRGQPENKGQFGPGGGGSQSKPSGGYSGYVSPEGVLRKAKSPRPMGAFTKAAHLAGAGYIAEAKTLIAGSGERARQRMAEANRLAVKATRPGGKKTAIKEDFDKAGIRLRVFGAHRENEAQKEKEALDHWNTMVDMPPDEFKAMFTGGQKGTMVLTADPDQDKYNVSGTILGEDDLRGIQVASYSRDINLAKKEAYSALFEVSDVAQKRGIAKRLLAGNVEFYEKMGIDKVKVTAGLTVGGYAWAKYGYVPDQQSWDDLRFGIKSRMDRAPGYSGNANADTYEAESWDELPEITQDEVRSRWLSDSYEEFMESEIDNWRDGEEPMREARRITADEFNGGGVMDMPLYAEEALDELTTQRRDDGENDYPYSHAQLYAAMELSQDDSTDGGDLVLTWDEDKLNSYVPPGGVPGQLTLPGVEEVKPADYLTAEMREEISARILEEAESKADDEAINIDPPDYLRESVREYQLEYWEMADESTRMDQARRFDLHNIEKVDFDEEEEVSPLEKGDPLDPLTAWLDNPDPKTIWKIADSARGKELLLKHGWGGTLNLKDKESYERFKEYVGRVKKPNAES